jgi:hypothetical protein
MGKPHKKSRYGELWNTDKVSAMLVEINLIKDCVIISGGWAWHLMTPKGHKELKHAHDHKDIDIFVKPEDFITLISILINRGFETTHSPYDSNTFYRYSKIIEINEKETTIVFDIFIEREVPYREVNGYKVVDPEHLLSLYGVIHTSDKCFAVYIARDLIAKGENIINNPKMADYDKIISSMKK